MEGKQLTETIFKKINKDAVLYAEMADRGAMGESGTARLYTLTGGKLNLYHLKLNDSKSKSNDELFDKLFDVLMSLTKDSILIYENAGYGNFAWRKAGIRFKGNDEDHSFTYKNGDKTYKIESSNSGLYQSVVYRFANRDLDYKIVNEWLVKNNKKIKTNDEYALIKMYIEVIRAADAGERSRELTVDDYWVTIKYIRWEALEDFNIRDEDRIDGIENVARYRLLFIVNQIGWRKVDEIFQNIIKHNITEIIKEFDKYLFEPIENFFSHPGYTDTEIDDPFGDGPHSIIHYCKYPLFMNIAPKTQLDIINQISEMSAEDIEKNTIPIQYYFANFALGEQRIPYTIILPAALHIVKTMPFNGNPEKHPEHLFWLACEIINNAWKYLEEKEDAQSKFRKTIYEAFWPRFGSIWPIRNYGQFKFNSETEQKIYNEALGWLMSLKDIDTRNPEIRDYLVEVVNRNNINTGSAFVTRRAITIALRDFTPEERLKKILNIYRPDIYPEVLSYPENIDEAKCLMEELFNPNGRITGINRIATLEQLLINPNPIGVGEYILKYINDNFDKLVDIMATDSANEKIDSKEVITSILTAIAKGISEENELAPYKEILKKALDIGINGKILEGAAVYARKHRKDILFQRSALQKIF